MRRAAEIALRIGAVFGLHVALYGALLWAAALMGELPEVSWTWRVPAPLALLALLNSCVFSYLVLRARGASASLGASVGLAFYGGHSVLQQVDGVAFPHVSPAGLSASSTFGLNTVFTLLFVPLALALLNAEHGAATKLPEAPAVARSPWSLAWRVALGIALHQAVFVAAGYLIASELLHPRAADGIDLELHRLLLEAPWLPGLQVVRGLLWLALSAPLVRLLRGASRWESSLALGAFWAVVGSGELGFHTSSLDFVARSHLAVFAGANFVAGAALGALLSEGRLPRKATRARGEL